MAAGVIYLDVDDEITSAASRVRASGGRRVALVLPSGSRVATSRINFRLLSRDALISEKQLAVIAADSATRALAASAGLPVFASVAEYESSLGGADETAAEPSSTAPLAEAPAPLAPPGNAQTVIAPPVIVPPAIAPPATSPRPPTVRPPSPTGPLLSGHAGREARSFGSTGQPRGRLPAVAVLAVVALVILAAGVGGYLFLPSATIVVTPRPEPITPLSLAISADPTISQPEPSTRRVPAILVPLQVSVSDTFPATGKRVEETKAIGRVRFSNLDFLRSNSIPSGSVISTNAGIRFQTDAAVTVPRADLIGLTLFPGRVTVGVTAVDAGLAANVEPNTIVVVPRGEDPQALKVVNPDATSGGTHLEFSKIAQADVDAALRQLTTALDTTFQAQLGDPAIAPTGATVFPETAVLAEPTPTVADPTTLVDQEVESFDLGLSATGTVIAVDESPIRSIAEEALRATVKVGHQLVVGSMQVHLGTPTVDGQVVMFPTTASALQVAILDPEALRARVLGQSVSDARNDLASFGDATVTTWPDWVGSIPTIESRVTVSIVGSLPAETPEPTTSPS